MVLILAIHISHSNSNISHSQTIVVPIVGNRHAERGVINEREAGTYAGVYNVLAVHTNINGNGKHIVMLSMHCNTVVHACELHGHLSKQCSTSRKLPE